MILHLQQLALEHGIEPDASEEVMQEVQEGGRLERCYSRGNR